MNAPPVPSRVARVSLAILALVLLGLAYRNTLHAPFIFDDRLAILDNPTIRQLWPLSVPLSPPVDGRAVAGRPLVNLSLALNYALSGTDPWSYHVANLAVHALSALLLFGIVRRTLLAPLLRERWAARASMVAWFVALLWALHPLQTEAVTCVVQRTESLAGFFYLLTLYAFIVGAADPRQRSTRWWLAVSVGACLCGMATKESMVTAPVIVWLYDRTFLTGKFGRAWRERRGFYLALGSTWLLLAWLVVRSHGARGTAAGFSSGMSAWLYLLQQTRALVLYLKLALWPDALVVDYGSPVPGSLSDVWWQALLVLVLLCATAWAFVRRPVLGFLGAWFFVILAPSSSFVPLAAQTMAEHRMYLPLASLVVGAVAGVQLIAPRWTAFVFLPLILLAGRQTWRHNEIFRSELTLWSDTVAKVPDNPRAQRNLGVAQLQSGHLEEAVIAFQRAARLEPASPEAHANLCHAFTRLGRYAEAIVEGETALALEPANVDAYVNLGQAYLRTGNREATRRQLGELIKLNTVDAEIDFLAGNLAVAAEDFPAALTLFRRAVAIDGTYVAARNNLANVLLVAGRFDEAIIEYQAVLRLRPHDRAVLENLQRARELRAAPAPKAP